MRFLSSTKSTSKLLSEKYLWVFRIRLPEFSSKFWFFLNCFQVSSRFGFKFRNVKLSKTEFSGSKKLNLVVNFDSFRIFFGFCPTLSSSIKMPNCQKLNFQDLVENFDSFLYFFLNSYTNWDKNLKKNLNLLLNSGNLILKIQFLTVWRFKIWT